MLSVSTLGQLERRWRAQSVPLLERWSDGLSDAAMDALAAPLGLHLPAEARMWWGWHDGVPAERCALARDRGIGGPGFQFLPLEEAIRDYRTGRRMVASGGDDLDVDRAWHPGWLPLTAALNGTVVLIDCSVAEDAASPIYALRWDSVHEPRQPGARSFGEMVGWWIEALDQGAWRYDAAIGRWNYDYEMLPPERELTGLV
jgi:cell wall assembly regulator SMI1